LAAALQCNDRYSANGKTYQYVSAQMHTALTAESFISQVNKLLPAQAATHAQQQPVLLSQRKSLEIRTLFHYVKLHLSIFS